MERTASRSRFSEAPMRFSRRQFLGTAAGTAAAAWLPRASASPNNKLNLACIGVAGRGAANLKGVASENIVALCDIDAKNLDKAAAIHPGARRHVDFRRMLEEQKDIDAVVI